MERVGHAVFLRLEIEPVMLGRGNLDGNVLDYLQAVTLQADTFHGIIGDQTHFPDTEFMEDLSPHAVVALISLMPQVEIGVYGVHALLLEFISPDFIHQTDAATFLEKIDYGAATFFVDHPERLMKLLAAITSERPENVAGGAG